jgi:homoserine O-acetyltransferase
MAASRSALGIVKKQEFRLPSYRTLGGDTLADVHIGYETYGTLSPARDNCILICHHFSGSSHAAGLYSDSDALPGYWDSLIGPGKAIDTERYFVVCADTLCCVPAKLPTTITTGPASLDPATGQPYGMRFPVISIEDSVHVQRALLDSLGIDRLVAVAGPSAGGVQAALWAVCYPERVARALMAVAPGVEMPAFCVGLLAKWAQPIRLDPHWNGGDYYGRQEPTAGLQAAIELMLLTTLHFEALQALCGRDWAQAGQDPGADFDHHYRVEAFLAQEAAGRVAAMEPNHLLYMARSLQQYSVRERLDGYRAKTLLIPAKSDLIFPPAFSHEFAQLLRQRDVPAQVIELEGRGGHLDGLARIHLAADAIREFLVS